MPRIYQLKTGECVAYHEGLKRALVFNETAGCRVWHEVTHGVPGPNPDPQKVWDIANRIHQQINGQSPIPDESSTATLAKDVSADPKSVALEEEDARQTVFRTLVVTLLGGSGIPIENLSLPGREESKAGRSPGQASKSPDRQARKSPKR